MRKNTFRFSFKEHLSIFLIFCLLVSQTIQVSFFDRTEAAADDYRDLVSIVVDRETYGKLSGKIKRYSEDVQGYLGNTRVSLFVVPKDTPPEAIAAQNEKLYYDGDGKDGITSLVGTVLIGNVPIPVVHRDSESFPSLYPYVDFDEKRFVYNQHSHTYQYAPDAQESTDVDIWHGVINPSVGRSWQGASDIQKISEFLDKTHDFYTKNGKFVSSTLPPRVFYYDGYNESAAIVPKSVFQYDLYIKNIENFAYKRFTKYLLTDIGNAIDNYDSANSDKGLDEYKASLGYPKGSNTLSGALVSTLPDIQTVQPISAYIKKFYEVLNKKTLSDEQLFVHNAGRYTSGATVRIDQATIQGTYMDEVAVSILKEGNTALEQAIDNQIKSANYPKKAVIFDKIAYKINANQNFYGFGATDWYTKVYNGYFFGKKSSEITLPDQCTIARGFSGTTADFGQSVRVEANAGYDINATQSQIDILTADTNELVNLHRSTAYSCFDTNAGSAKIASYWGGNSILRVAGGASDTTNVLNTPINSQIKGYSLPIFSLQGMKETPRLANPGLADCNVDNYQYSLLEPYTSTTNSFFGNSITNKWPSEWNGTAKSPRYSCLTQHDSLASIPSLPKSLADYEAKTCFVGSVYIDGASAKSLGNYCYLTEEGMTYSYIPTGAETASGYSDVTHYEDRYYHTIPSLWKHISPTDEEIAAATTNGVTPSTPVDIKRSVEFLTAKGNIARFEYPDFFQSPGKNVATVRAWLKDISEKQWNAVIAKENATTLSTYEQAANSKVASAPLPATPIDWNSLISDDAINKIIQSQNWLHPDITQKAKNAIETSLSYSHQYGSDITKNPPSIPEMGSGYDVAYLGLSSLSPLNTSFSASDTLETDYATTLAEIQALNMGEDGVASAASDYQASAKCGPPEGVMIFQWPSAIMCWISSLFPPRISGGSCGGSTIGSTDNARASTSPSREIQNDVTKIKAYYAAAKLVYNLPKTAIGVNESSTIEYDFITKDNAHIELPIGSTVKLDIITLESQGKTISPTSATGYLEIAPAQSPYSNLGGSFVLLSHDKLLKSVLRATISIPLPDGTIYTSVSDNLNFRVSDESIDVFPTVEGSATGTIDTTLASPVKLSFAPKTSTGLALKDEFPYTLDVYDSFDDSLIESGITIPNKDYTVSYNYTKKIGTYHFVIRDAAGRYGDTTLSVRSGPLAKTTFAPISSALIVGSDSLGVLRLTDKLGNLLSPELHSINITAKGGYIIDSEGTHVTELNLDSINSEMILSYGSSTAGKLTLSISIDGVIQTEATIDIFPTARIVFERSSQPVVAGAPITAHIKVLDGNGNIISGFSSVADMTLPEAAGYFASGTTVEIKSGQSADFTFVPGRVAGEHMLTLDIPGVGTVSDIPFTIAAGVPMYMNASYSDTTFSFVLRDRYGNLSPRNMTATMTRNTDASQAVAFSGGVYSQTRKTGFYKMQAPDIAKNTLTYSDASGSYTITGVTYASLYVPPTQTDFSFLPDYNARYTVLAGNSFLRQGEQILYSVTPGASSSLAVSTLLDSPYTTNTLLSVIPGGGFSLGQSLDTAVTAGISLEKNTLVLSARDDVSHKEIGRVGYPIANPDIDLCTENLVSDATCDSYFGKSHIRLIAFSGSEYQSTVTKDSLALGTKTANLLQYRNGQGFTLMGGVTLIPEASRSARHLEISVKYDDQIIARLIVATDVNASVLQASDVTSSTISTPILQNRDSSMSVVENYVTEFTPNIHGYSVVAPDSTQTLDEKKIGPNHIDSLGSLSELPGVGWRDQNRLLLSYSAGDTVGEASRWFHTYTYVNLGDPVAHVDHGAVGTEQEGIDRTIGTQIASSAHGAIRSYYHKDMNHDGNEDIVIVYSDGYIELLLNINGKFRSKKMIASLPDVGNRGVSVGDFTGDGYGDIIAVNASGSLILVDNDSRKLTRTSISLSDTMSVVGPTGITQFQVYDMDADGRDDIVYLTEMGELGVLYGTVEKGKFVQNILDKTLAVSLSEDPVISGGAITATVVPQLENLNTPSTSTGTDDKMLKGEVYFQRTVYDTTAANALPGSDVLVTDVSAMTGMITSTLTDPNTVSEPTKLITYVKNEYATAYGMEISKSYKNISGKSLVAGSKVQVDVTIKNTSSGTIKNAEYLDMIPSNFTAENTTKYTLSLNGQSEDRVFRTADDTYDASFVLKDIPAGVTLHLIYEVEALATSYGKMIVAKLEGGEVGDDIYGDVGFESSTTCGANMVLWRSGGARDYTRGTRSYTAATIPDSIASQLTDADKNAVPDSVEDMSLSDRQAAYKQMTSDSSVTPNTSSLAHAQVNAGGNIVDIGLSSSSASEINTIAKNLADTMSCGFGGGSCMSFPVNWAPLAPGSDPSVFGMPVGDGLNVGEGLPIFSALTEFPVGVFPYCFDIPSVWPISPRKYDPTDHSCSVDYGISWMEAGAVIASAGTMPSLTLGAGGMLGTSSVTNQLRIFVTPTLTLGMGTAICMGGPATALGRLPFPGLYPLVSGGNCFVMTKPMSLCKGDGSAADGSIVGVSGLGSTTDTWNGESCSLQATTTTTAADDKNFSNSVVDYLKSKDTTKLNNIYTALSKRGSRNNSGGPAIRIGGGTSGGGGTEIAVDFDSNKPLTVGNIIKVKNKRVSDFPDFLMDWVSRQVSEITNKLFSLPNLIIIPPTTLGPNAQTDGSVGSYGKLFSSAADKASVSDLKSQMKGAFDNTNAASSFNKRTSSNSSASSGYNTWLDNKVQENSSTINTVQGSANALKSAYKMIGQIPFLRIRQSAVTVNVPWPLPQELDKYSRSLDQYKKEIDTMKKNWCSGNANAECLDQKTSLNVSSFRASVERGLKMIDEYRKFPEKVQKYVTWRQRYTAWAMCNIETIQQFTGKWIKENGVRFQKWAEFYVLMKAIAKSWQPVIDVFRDGNAQCSVCQNQRYTLDYFKFKLISALIPSIPVIQFPKWPDIVLDLSDVRLAITIDVPDYKFNVTPLRLPNLPSLSLPSLPSLSLSLPSLPSLPRIPELPNFPDLPSLPKISFPPLPPPPKLPKMFGAVSIVTNLVKLYQMIKCYYQNSTLVPEWQVGDVIAQRTARQGTLSLDFLNLQFPQASMPSVREIRVQSHVNFELKSDFITEYARNAVKPVNSFNTDLSRSIPSKVGTDVSIQTPGNVNVAVPPVQSYLDASEYSGSTVGQMMAKLEQDSHVMMDVSDFIPYFQSELLKSGQSTDELNKALQKSHIESEKVMNELQESTDTQAKLLKQYIKAEEAKTKDIEKLIDTMKHPNMLLSANDIGTASFVSEANDAGAQALDRYNEFMNSSVQDSSASSNVDTSIETERTSLQNRTKRLIAAVTTTTVTPESGGVTADGYSPKFEGIYILTPSGVQTRLFDYIQPLLGDETVDVLDIDKDGDKDYLYLMDGILYLKSGHAHEPSRQKDTTITISDLDPTLVPEAPNFFQEFSASPGQIELNFSAAQNQDRQFRLEFFDRYTEWDLLHINAHDEKNIPRSVVDIINEDTSHDTSADGITVHPLERSLDKISGTDGFILEGPKVTPVAAGTNFSLTYGRPLYTGESNARITFALGDGAVQNLTLKPYSQYIFDDTLSGSLTSGRVYFFDTMVTEKTSYDDSLVGMPLLPKMKISNLGGTFTIRDVTHDTKMTLESGGQYRIMSLPALSTSNIISVPYENGFYNARLSSLDSTVHAGVTLFTPQASLDHGAPVVDISDTIRIPVYQTKSYALADIITEISPYTVTVDPDTTQDTNSDGIYDNDYTTTASGVSITEKNLTFGSYSELGEKGLSLNVQDEYGNTTTVPIRIEVYAPVPQIQSISATGMLYGSLIDGQKNEPIHFLRVRSGTPISIITPEKTISLDDGSFATGTLFTGSGARFSYSGGTFVINEQNGLPVGSSKLNMQVLAATVDSPMKFQYKNTNGKTLFEQFLSLPSSTSISLSASETLTPSVVVTAESGYRAELATLKDPNIPGGAYITNDQHQSLAALANDGNIYILGSDLTLVPTTKNGYLAVEIQKNGKRIATVLYQVNFFYTVK